MPIYVNDGPLEASEMGRLEPSSPDLPLDELKSRFKKDGYLFLKGLVPRQDVLKCREEYFKFLSPTGVLKPGSEPIDGIYDSDKEITLFPGIGVGRLEDALPVTKDFVSRAIEAHYCSFYTEDLCKHPSIHGFVARFTGWGSNTRGLERTLLRNNIPKAKAIGVHYDQIFLCHGDPTSITVWVPLGDIKVNGGGLIYLENGQDIGQSIEEGFTAKASEGGFTDGETKSAFNQNMLASGLLTDRPAEFARHHCRRWLISDYEAGDVILHSPYAVHASTVNHDPSQIIRLATDLRFVDSSKPWDKRWSNHFQFGDGL